MIAEISMFNRTDWQKDIDSDPEQGYTYILCGLSVCLSVSIPLQWSKGIKMQQGAM